MDTDSAFFLSERGDRDLEKFLQEVHAGRLTRSMAIDELRQWQRSCRVDSDLSRLLEEVEDFVLRRPEESAVAGPSPGEQNSGADQPDKG